MNIFYCNLEAVKASSFWDLNLCGKVGCEVLVNDSVRGGKKCEDVGNEMAFVLV